MPYTILLYGATGYSGQLIAEEAAARGMTAGGDADGYRMVLAGRNRTALTKLARSLKMEPRAFPLDDADDVLAQLRGVNVIINAAGPFAMTAPLLARAALGNRCHYVDINGESEVYMRLDDLSRDAVARRVALVSGAGHTSAASCLLLELALAQLRAETAAGYSPTRLDLGSIRIAMSRLTTLSRGSLETLTRSLREQVRIVRVGMLENEYGTDGEDGEEYRKPKPGHTYWHVPVGQLERAFDYAVPKGVTAPSRRNPALSSDRRIASAANLLDTITARRTVERHRFLAHRIESYVEVGQVGRVVFQAAPMITPFAATSLARDLACLQFSPLPDGPTKEERRREDHVVVLEIEDLFQSRVLHWAWRTPNPYDFTARVVLETARRVAATTLVGWLTPAQVLTPESPADLSADRGYLRGCTLQERPAAVPEFTP
jgi:short subunit dehydrogenase-like uncharacterized protein